MKNSTTTTGSQTKAWSVSDVSVTAGDTLAVWAWQEEGVFHLSCGSAKITGDDGNSLTVVGK